VEGLSRALHREKNQGLLNGVKIVGDLSISHLLFVDDILLFGLGSVREGQVLKDILNVFSSAIGMLINLEKSALYINGVDDGTTRFDRKIFSIPLKY
jgi:hypothetical protein